MRWEIRAAATWDYRVQNHVRNFPGEAHPETSSKPKGTSFQVKALALASSVPSGTCCVTETTRVFYVDDQSTRPPSSGLSAEGGSSGLPSSQSKAAEGRRQQAVRMHVRRGGCGRARAEGRRGRMRVRVPPRQRPRSPGVWGERVSAESIFCCASSPAPALRILKLIIALMISAALPWRWASSLGTTSLSSPWR